MEPNAKVQNWVILELQGHPTDSQTPRTTAAPPDPSRFPSGPAPHTAQPWAGTHPRRGPASTRLRLPVCSSPGLRSGQPQHPPRPRPSHLRTALLSPPRVEPPVASAASEQVALRVQPRGRSGNGRLLQPASWWGAPIGQRAQGRRRDWPGARAGRRERGDGALAGCGRRGAAAGSARSDAQRNLNCSVARDP